MNLLALVTVSVALLTLYVAPFLPLVTAFVTNCHAPPWVKLLTTTALAFVVAVVTTAVETNVDVVLRWSLLVKFAVTLGEAMFGYLGWRTIGVTDTIERKVPGGIGA